ncbi:unnamed protein product [Rhizoctonia solani]|nr:unnamed protein product [Rhizoctonia solani]
MSDSAHSYPSIQAKAGCSRQRRAKDMVPVMVSKLKTSMGLLQRGWDKLPLLQPLGEAAEALRDVLDVIGIAPDNMEELQDMSLDLEEWSIILAGYLQDSKPNSVPEQVQHLISVLKKETEYIRQQSVRRTTRLDECDQKMDKLEQSYSRIEKAFRQLQVDASLSTWKIADKTRKHLLLDAMAPAHAAQYDSSYADKIDRGPCLEGTRETVLEDIRKWIYNPDNTQGYWVNGMAGTGKTTIAYSICRELAENGRLGASFFVSRASAECSDVSKVLPTIAYQLAHVSYAYQHVLCQALEKQMDVAQRKMAVQFEHLIQLPLRQMVDALPKGLVVVIDALDECTDPKSTELVIRMLLRHASKLPIRFLLMSRPEPAISNAILSKDNGSTPTLHLHSLEEQLVKADIKRYLTVSLARVKPTDDQIEWLVEQAGALFIYAATLVRYILATELGVDPAARLKSILATRTTGATKKHRAIDNLYGAILEPVLQGEGREEYEVKAIQQVLWTVVCVQEAVTLKTLAILAQLDEDKVSEALRPMKSLIHISEGSGVVSTLHASFPEFMLDFSRSGPCCCDAKAHNQYLAIQCLALLDKHAPCIDSLRKPEFFYARHFWIKHLRRGTIWGTFFQSLNTFKCLRLLANWELIDVLFFAYVNPLYVPPEFLLCRETTYVKSLITTGL